MQKRVATGQRNRAQDFGTENRMHKGEIPMQKPSKAKRSGILMRRLRGLCRRMPGKLLLILIKRVSK